MSPAGLAFVEDIEKRIKAAEFLARLSPAEERQKRLCAIVREQDASTVSLRDKLVDETAQRELVASQLEDAMEANRELGKANTALLLERDALRKAWLLASDVAAATVKENCALRERLAKLEALGPWIEANRLAQLRWADEADARGDVNRREQRATFEARADAFKQVGYELNNRTGQDLRK